jgi:hypothetical protein
MGMLTSNRTKVVQNSMPFVQRVQKMSEILDSVKYMNNYIKVKSHHTELNMNVTSTASRL